jgi:hypothetical protein|tara:strand:- start:959 stop:1843 length:885 start_codon:yes stop_codon:yes gene_type:complete
VIHELRERLDTYFYWIHERETIRLNKEVEQKPPPWTDDSILQKFKFCQVFREDDRTTRWFRTHIRDPYRDDPEVLMATVIFRWFNYIETGRTLVKNKLHLEWDRKKAIEEITKQNKWVTGAYIVKTPNRMDKVTGVAECISHMWGDREKLVEKILATNSLEESWNILRDYPYMGPFMAYEVITDLRHTYLLRDAEDILTWANAGPGAMRGLNRLAGRELGFCKRSHPWNEEMRNLWEISREKLNPNLIDLDKFEMREIEGGLCEFDKYSRILNEEGRTRSVYKYNEDLPLVEEI